MVTLEEWNVLSLFLSHTVTLTLVSSLAYVFLFVLFASRAK